LVLLLATVILTVFLILQSLKENVIYFQSPSEINSLIEIESKKIRVGGMVKEKSVVINSNEVNFIITDFKNEINVTYSGAVPNLFAEGKGVVAEGFLKDKNYFSATKILAKHDENYMPPEVKEALGVK
jgi:cytochrome c-type biogenesis protein CcmE